MTRNGTGGPPSQARGRKVRRAGQAGEGAARKPGGRPASAAKRKTERPAGAAPKPRLPARPAREDGERRTPEIRRAKPAKDAAASPVQAEAAPPSLRAVRAEAPVPSGVQILKVEADEGGMRLDRFLSARFPALALTHIQRIVRKGEVRVSGHRAKPNDRLEAGVGIRVPPLKLDALPERPTSENEADAAYLKSIALFEDADVLVINKPMGLAVQGGPGVFRHVDGLLESLRDAQGQKPRLVHRLDKDTAGCLVIAKTRFAAAALAKSFRSRATRKIYWALVAGVPRVRQGRISTYLAKEEVSEFDARMRVADHGDEGASHALTYYAVVDQAAQKLAWLSLKPVTGRTHQLRAHAAHIGHPIVGDPKYFDVENWELPGGIQNKLHLLARRIVVPHPRTGRPLDITAPLPPHIQQSFALLGFDTSRYDPIEDAPER
jgi:23S rRNA pseudouridine955/2504/2580 synthase